ncbi:plasmid pRiA4b ORF-3 family protein [Escherichia coli]|uniref:plasmid pRiA4b ORF-3 family protein n=1 Tax=Escherichia coli TaxID=562 RepID=UPI0005792E55|nr:plasmid pRiA4b ORF-3 family protein [Escherichia coli]
MNYFYQLKITLKHIEPAVWRRFVVPANLTLDRLHDVVQIVMGWDDSHLHNFKFKKQIYTEFPEAVNETDEAEIRLNELLKSKRNKLTYTYDFGDCWEHEIVLEDKSHFGDEMQTPFECVEGSMMCPPEDIGGPESYMHFLKVIFDPQNNEEEYEAYLEILGLEEKSNSDIKEFIFSYDRDVVNAALQLYARWSRERALAFDDDY